MLTDDHPGCGGIIRGLERLVDWVENGVAPGDVECDLGPGETLAVRPYPYCFDDAPGSRGVSGAEGDKSIPIPDTRLPITRLWAELVFCDAHCVPRGLGI